MRVRLQRDRARVKQGGATGQRGQALRLDPEPGSFQLWYAAVWDLHETGDQPKRAELDSEYLSGLWPTRYPR